MVERMKEKVLMPTRLAPVCGLLAIALIQGCSKAENAEQTETRAAQIAGWEPEFIDDDRLLNAYRLNDKVISGGAPEEPSMQALKELGVKTIISVDGAQPDVDLAKQYGMRYVHLPHGYDGIPEQRAMELAKAVTELDGPVYVHCHHGKHRSPAAAATACVVAGMLSPDQGLAVLKAAGTSEGYRGLYRKVGEGKPADRAALDQFRVDYRETAPVTPMAEAMVALEKTHDHLNQISKNEWRPLEKQRDLDPAHEALLLEEHYTELLRTKDVQKRTEEFRMLLKEGEAIARQLKEQLNAKTTADRSAEDRLALAQDLTRVTQNCKTCHQKFRDITLEQR
jgi:protein tyrosine phosphatase (PTP) superfamily phosphohydrolase (DUF442 family)